MTQGRGYYKKSSFRQGELFMTFAYRGYLIKQLAPKGRILICTDDKVLLEVQTECFDKKANKEYAMQVVDEIKAGIPQW